MTRTLLLGALGLLGASCAATIPEEAAGQPLELATAPVPLEGTWVMELTVPAGQPFAGTYMGTLLLREQEGALYGAVEDWSNGARSRFTGSQDRGRVRLDRVDAPPYEGFRSYLTGVLAPSGLRGTFRNDPGAPFGNGATGTWRAARVR